MEILRLRETSIKDYQETFGLQMPNSTVEPVKYDHLPKAIKKQMEDKENCGASFKINHPDQTKTYVAEFLGLDVFFFHEITKRGIHLGSGHTFVESSEESEIPVVGYTYTNISLRRSGFGTRRLFIMNSVSQAKYEATINSSARPRLPQKALWESLVEKEIAEKHDWNGTERFRFLS